jgi:GT2 family glycosyltransferase
MFASQVRMANSADGKAVLDSAGMLVAADGSSKQRGHGQSPEAFAESSEALFPSGSAALYRREMVEAIGGFDESFFLYCEDTDLGLRARWAGWECRYVPGARVEHRYSHSAGRASTVKAYYVERNRLYTVLKNFPLRLLLRVPFAAAARYFWHLISLMTGRGKAAEFRTDGQSAALLPFLVFRAHAAALMRMPRLLPARRAILKSRKITTGEFEGLLARHSIPVRQVAAL